MITEKELKNFKKETFSLIKHMIDSAGGINPMLIILVDGRPSDVPTSDKKAAMVIDIPHQYMETQESKTFFIEHAMPIVAKKLKNDGINASCICFCSEAWLRSVGDTEEIPDNWKDFSKKEVLILSFEYKGNIDFEAYTIKRDGMMVTENNKLVETVHLTKDEEFSKQGASSAEGPFANLFKKYFE